MRIHRKSSVAGVCAAAVALGLGACSNSSQTRATAPQAAAAQPPPEYAPQEGVETNERRDAGPAEQAPQSEPGATNEQSPETWGGQPPAGQQGAAQNTPPPAVSSPTGVTNPMPGADVAGMSDAQLAAIVRAINRGEIQEAQLAETKASAAAVKKFAKHMLDAHRDMMNKDAALLARLRIVPSDTATSRQLEGDTQVDIASLRSARGKDFDRDYVDAQVHNHKGALELFDQITPNVKNGELRAAIQGDRPRLEEHLREAERIQQSLTRGTTNMQAPDLQDEPPPDNLGPRSR